MRKTEVTRTNLLINSNFLLDTKEWPWSKLFEVFNVLKMVHVLCTKESIYEISIWRITSIVGQNWRKQLKGALFSDSVQCDPKLKTDLIYGIVLTDMFHKLRLDLRDKLNLRDSK